MNKLFLCIAMCFILSTSASYAAWDAFLKIDGVEGESVDQEFPNSIDIQSFSWGVSSPRDAASGLATGRRQYEPIRFIKRIDKASPLLAKACAQGQHIKSATLFVRRQGATGAQETYYKIELEDVFISSVAFLDDGNSTSDEAPMESISFTYAKITWTHIPSKVSASDDWQR